MMPARETAYDVFWRRQSLRWLTGEAPDPVALTVPAVVAPGSAVPIDVAARDASFAPVARAVVTLAVRGTDAVRDLGAGADAPGHASARWQADAPGLYQIAADVTDGQHTIGSASRFVLVGGVDPEFVDPRLNEAALRRLSAGTGGEDATPADASRIAALLRRAHAAVPPREVRDLWDNAGRCSSSWGCSPRSGRCGGSGGSGDAPAVAAPAVRARVPRRHPVVGARREPARARRVRCDRGRDLCENVGRAGELMVASLRDRLLPEGPDLRADRRCGRSGVATYGGVCLAPRSSGCGRARGRTTSCSSCSWATGAPTPRAPASTWSDPILEAADGPRLSIDCPGAWCS